MISLYVTRLIVVRVDNHRNKKYGIDGIGGTCWFLGMLRYSKGDVSFGVDGAGTV